MKDRPVNIQNPSQKGAPPAARAQSEAGLISVKCRTLEEASLICEQLEKADIIVGLPEDQELESQFREKGYVEIKVSTAAYAQLTELKSSVEFLYQHTAAEKRLSTQGILLSIGCGLLTPFGALVFLKLFFSNKRSGYIRRSREIAFWFVVGAIIWAIAVLVFGLALATMIADNTNKTG
jgi:hypothetical protein